MHEQKNARKKDLHWGVGNERTLHVRVQLMSVIWAALSCSDVSLRGAFL